jgi:predicted DNA-binding protein
MSYMQQGAARISKHSSENLKSMSNWIEETKVWVVNDYIEPGRENLTELAKAIETFFNDINGIYIYWSDWLNFIASYTAFFIALPAEIEAYCMSLEEVQFAVEVFKELSAWFEDFKFIHYATKIQAGLVR